jgi:hypothetical protein
MDDDFIAADLHYGGMHYIGRISPERKHGELVSWHVVLNDTFFGYMSHNGNLWTVTEQRPDGLVQAVGHYIDTHRNKLETVSEQ